MRGQTLSSSVMRGQTEYKILNPPFNVDINPPSNVDNYSNTNKSSSDVQGQAEYKALNPPFNGDNRALYCIQVYSAEHPSLYLHVKNGSLSLYFLTQNVPILLPKRQMQITMICYKNLDKIT